MTSRSPLPEDYEQVPLSLVELGDGELARRIAVGAARAVSAGGRGAEGDHAPKSPASIHRSDMGAEEQELCRRFTRPVRLYGLRHLGNEEAARDLAQDVMLLTLEKLRRGEVRDPERIGSFVLGVARMLARSRQRSRRREAPLTPEVEETLVALPERISPLVREHLTHCLETLAESQRSVLVLTYYGGQSSDEIASSLGLSVANVRVIRHRAMAGLRDCVGSVEGMHP